MTALNKFSFWVWNWLFFPDQDQVKVIDGLKSRHRSKSKKWFLTSVVINIFPFILAAIVEAIINNSNILCFLNNGSLPILCMSIVATNLFYLQENIPSDLKPEEVDSYDTLKSTILTIGFIILITSTILYIFQSNFLSNFNYSHLWISLIISTLTLGYSISCGKKMFLLQKSYILSYREKLDQDRKNLNDRDNTDGFTTE
ncbi:hypothetical protein J0X19_23170 [Hymenobacter sp. BT186]|uniref:Uncharacterized protein n=1 Tax=Hymenobacter telluris TaxID=2816474 RepID=A0A939JEW9_9BACT|nr:hypothetical protein [Hymenobacter telluris]MBO0360880.1 hypothetical protein [Hymenobacter telluris]MBW3376909.1 hypothetical protein [Hymenobacter norwichensis]